MARATTSRSSLISVGRKPVVPKRRCARPIAAMRLDARIVVEQHAAAAVDLRVDEARHQQVALEIEDALGAARLRSR